MKKFFPILFILIFTSISYSQVASNYFPSSTGYRWNYKNTPLDSLNNPQTSQATYQVDSFAVVQNYQGLPASLVLSKSGLTNINQNLPYTDTSYFNFQSSNGYYYLNLLSFIGSIPIIDSLAFINFLRSFEAWYSTYRFAQTVNSNYTIFTRDTTITFDTLTLPLRLALTGRRLNDQTISTVNGNYLAKKFILTFALSYGLLPPFIYIPIVTQPDTSYIAENVWVVRECRPSINVDLTSLGFPLSFTIPGSLKELTAGSTGILTHTSLTADKYKLYQNYPNPFNPSTVIRYSIPSDVKSQTSNVSLKVYSNLGKEIMTLVNEKQNAGSYEVKFNGSNLSSGIYFYKLETGDFSETKRMILLK